MVHIFVLTWHDVHTLVDLWIRPIGLTPQEGRLPWIIYDYTWSGLNKAFLQQAPLETMEFRQTLPHLL